MIRLPLIIAGGAAAAAVAVIPAAVGLTGNPSFSQQVPVRIPAHAKIASFPAAPALPDWHVHGTVLDETEPSRNDRHRTPNELVRTRLASPGRSEPEPGDDRGRRKEPEPSERRGHGREHSRGRDDGSKLSARSGVESETDRAAVEGRHRGDDDGRR